MSKTPRVQYRSIQVRWEGRTYFVLIPEGASAAIAVRMAAAVIRIDEEGLRLVYHGGVLPEDEAVPHGMPLGLVRS